MKKVILTGHGKGLGKALARALVKSGFDVLGLSRSCSDEMSGLQQVSLDLSDSAAQSITINLKNKPVYGRALPGS